MKQFIILSVVILTLFSCKKEKTFMSFTEKQLNFVNYYSGQSIKFLDTLLMQQTLNQDTYRREFDEMIGVTGSTGNFVEEYEVNYTTRGTGNINLYISQDAGITATLFIAFDSYRTYARADSLYPSFSSININGKEYTNVYTLKMFKDGQFINNNDTATLFHNRQYGVVQLLFPNGKRILRLD